MSGKLQTSQYLHWRSHPVSGHAVGRLALLGAVVVYRVGNWRVMSCTQNSANEFRCPDSTLHYTFTPIYRFSSGKASSLDDLERG